MSDYISREALIEHLRKDPLFDLVERHGITGVINSIPAADVRPVVRSKWIKMKFFHDWECEKCGSVISGNAPDPWNHYHYCPNCGADMRSEPPKEESYGV